MSNVIKNIFIRSRGFIFLVLFLYLLSSNLSSAVEIYDYEKYKGKKFGPEYFSAIQGRIYGQSAPGVQAVYINGKSIPIDKNLNFGTNISLKNGEKYLTIKTVYKGLQFKKIYLVIRHPKAPKTFEVHLPRKEFQKIIKTKKAAPKKKLPKKVLRRLVPGILPKPPQIKEKWLGFEFLAELEPGKFLVVRSVDGKYFALIFDSKTKIWVPLHKISHPEFKALLEKGSIPSSFDP